MPDYTPLQAWRNEHFGSPTATGAGANDADPDGDEVTNLVEYITGTSPVANEPTLNASRGLELLRPASAQSVVQFRLFMDAQASADPKVRVTIQQSTTLTAWETQNTRVGGTSWTGSQPTSTMSDGVINSLFTPGFTPQTKPLYFLRLWIEELP